MIFISVSAFSQTSKTFEMDIACVRAWEREREREREREKERERGQTLIYSQLIVISAFIVE